MIDGYSVQEAASVLGVPEGRVWELLARGVLSGTPEGDSMRVYLKVDAGPIAKTSQRDEAPKANGNGGTHANGGEASAFRELLTEFRNLTERYGQALLALGEARGEVAGLRSRVELLEARLDLRLPTTPDAAPVGWGSPPVAPVALDVPPIEPARAETRPAGRQPAPPTTPPRRSARSRKERSSRSAVDSFAQALARAQDPTTAEVSDQVVSDAHIPQEAEDRLASPIEDFVEGSVPESAAADAAPEPIAPEAEVIEPQPEPVAAELEVDAAEPEPQPEPVAELEVAAAEPEPQPEPVAAELEVAAAELEVAAAEPEAQPEPQPVAAEPVTAEIQAAFGEAAITPDESENTTTVAEATATAEPDATATAEPEPAQPTYSTAVVEPDWFADGDFAWLDAAELEASSPSVAGAVEPPPAEPAAAEPAAAELAPAELAPVEPAAVYIAPDEPESAPEPAPEAVSAIETEAAPWAEAATIAEPDRPLMPDLPPMPDLPSALDLPAAPEAQVQSGPQLEAEPDVTQSIVELIAPIRPFEPAEPVEQENVEPAAPGPPEPMIEPSTGPSEEEVMWLGAEGRAADEIETAGTGWRAEPRSMPTATAPPPVRAAEPPLLRMTEEELARLARDEGWDEAEIAAIRAMIVPPPPRQVQLPGAAALDDAMAALHAVPVDPTEHAYPSREWAKPPGETRAARYDDWAFEVEPASSPKPFIEQPRRQPTDPGWLRQRQGPAATAYRRLRRLFPG